MPLNPISFNELDMGGGIDAQSPETNLQEGHAEDIIDMDPQSRGSVAKRKGFESVGGSLPLRVTDVSQEGGEICFSLEEAIDVSKVGNRPVLVSGISYNGATYDRDATAETWFPSILTEVEKELPAAGAPLIISAADHGFATSKIQLQVKEITPEGHSHLLPDYWSIDESTLDITIAHNSPTAIPVYVVIINSADEVGKTHITEVAADTTSVSIPAATHQLDHTQILPAIFVQESPGDEWVHIFEDELIIDSLTGDVTVNFTNNPGLPADTLRIILRAADIDNVVSGTIAPSSTQSIQISDTETPFQFISIFVEDGTDLIRVLPNSIIHDTNAATTTIEFVNPGTGATFDIYWDDATLETNRLCVLGTLADANEWENPTSAVWGLISYHILPTSTQDQGRALFGHHLSTYSAQGLKFPISAMMGTPARLNTDSHEDLFPRLSSRVGGDQFLRPFITDSGLGGRVESSAGGFHRLNVSSITWTSGTSVDVVVDAPDLVVNDLTIDRDELTLTGCGRSTNEGVWPITAAVAGVNSITFTVTIPARVDALDDETDTGAFAAIYTDSLLLQDSAIFLPGDEFQAANLSTQSLEVIGQSGTTIYLRNVLEEIEMPGGLRVRAIRFNAKAIPLRDSLLASKVEPLVSGDAVSVGSESRNIRIANVRSQANLAATFTQDDNDLLIDVASVDGFFVGRLILIHDDGSGFGGEHTVTSIPSDTRLVVAFPTGADASGTGTVLGHVVELDESIDELTDDTLTKMTRTQRWFPIDTISGEVNPWRAHPASNQPLLRSALAKDSTYFAGTLDPVFKFDGQQISRAGLPRIQADLFLNKDTSATGKIVLSNPQVSANTISVNKFSVSPSDLFTFRVGDRIEHSTDSVIYTVEEIDESNNNIVVDRTITGAAGNLTRVSRFTYYIRLNMIDANGGLIGSAAVGSNDLVVEIGDDAAVHLRAHKFPALDSFDFDRLELEIFRTKKDTAGPFFKIATLPLSNETTPYVDFTDTTPDETLGISDFDAISSALEGVELGTQWEGPLPSSYIAGVGNRVVLANCRSWPTIDIRLKRNIDRADAANLNGLLLDLRRDNTDLLPDQTFELVDSSTSETVTAGVVTSIVVNANEYVYLFTDSPDSSLDACGWFQADGFGSVDTQSSSFSGTRRMARATVAGIPVFVNDFNASPKDYNWPKQNLVGGASASVEGQAARRLAGAINWWQSTLSDAWLTAGAGGDFEFGQIVLKSPRYESTIFESEITLNGADLDIFANGLLRTDGEQVSALTSLHPSRLITSEVNFPEIFNAPDVALDVLSRGVIDVNPDDGEEITGLATFFGESTSSSANLQSIVVVFKESSIYLVDPTSGSVQRLQTEGKGCTVPNSVVSIKGGIVFANISGIYVLDSNFQLQFIGRTFDRKWKEISDSTYATAAAGLKNSENKYMLRAGDTTIVYDTTRIYEAGKGSFTTYSSHDAVSFLNFGIDHLWTSERGSVLRSRNTGTDKDYLQEGQAVTCQLTWRPLSFGDAVIRKTIIALFTHFRVLTDTSTVTISTKVDFDGTYEASDTAYVTDNAPGLASRSLITLKSSPATPRGVFFSIRWESAEAVPFEISGYGIRLAGLTHKTIAQAGNSNS